MLNPAEVGEPGFDDDGFSESSIGDRSSHFNSPFFLSLVSGSDFDFDGVMEGWSDFEFGGRSDFEFDGRIR